MLLTVSQYARTRHNFNLADCYQQCLSVTRHFWCHQQVQQRSMCSASRDTDKLVNILVDSKETKLLEDVRRMVNPKKYLVYPISKEDLVKSSWTGSCRLIILGGGCTTGVSLNTFRQEGGAVLHLQQCTGQEDLSHRLSSLGIDVRDVAAAAGDPLTGRRGYFLSSAPNLFFQHANVKERLVNNRISLNEVGLKFIANDESCDSEENDDHTIYLQRARNSPTFAFDAYTKLREAHEIGQHILHIPSISSSMLALQGGGLVHGLAVVPDQQTRGRGRGSNLWISPPGCAMFSLQLHLDLSSELGKRPSLVQHLIGLAAVLALKKINAELDVRLKWPNDIYYGNKTKLGGVIVESSILRSNMILNVGCGLNLTNEEPTLSVNQLVTGLGAPSVTREEYLAHLFNALHSLITSFNAGQKQHVFELYYEHWLHQDQEVTVSASSKNSRTNELSSSAHEGESERTRIIGIDEYGYLRVRTASGLQFSVHDDGNSFDMMRGLIKPKH